MVAITATSNATPSLQSVLNRSRLEQGKVRTLTSQARQSETTYTSAVKGRTAEVSPATQDFVERMYKATSQKFAESGNPLKTSANSSPVINVQGQSTGRIVNIAV